MTCDHPVECYDEAGDCPWCEEVHFLRDEVEALRTAIEKKAYVVKGGEAHHFTGDIGYLAVYSGTVHCQSMSASHIRGGKGSDPSRAFHQ